MQGSVFMVFAENYGDTGGYGVFSTMATAKDFAHQLLMDEYDVLTPAGDTEEVHGGQLYIIQGKGSWSSCTVNVIEQPVREI